MLPPCSPEQEKRTRLCGRSPALFGGTGHVDRRHVEAHDSAPLRSGASGKVEMGDTNDQMPRLKRKSKIPNFRSDRKAADFWATHDAARYAKDLKEEPVTVDTALRRRVARAKELARRK